MELGKKLQQLRKQKNLTQEQLAEQLFVSRTAISKWEGDKGYPGIESLKCISKLFSVSIDELLSSDELISLAVAENRSNICKVYSLIFGILDLMTVIFIFLPFYGQPEGEFIRPVSLLAYQGVSKVIFISYFVVLILMSLLGLAELIIQFSDNRKGFRISKTSSMILHSLTILLFVLTRKPYVASLLFVFFIIKFIILIRNSKVK